VLLKFGVANLHSVFTAESTLAHYSHIKINRTLAFIFNHVEADLRKKRTLSFHAFLNNCSILFLTTTESEPYRAIQEAHATSVNLLTGTVRRKAKQSNGFIPAAKL
jgi:hypothetical protein